MNSDQPIRRRRRARTSAGRGRQAHGDPRRGDGALRPRRLRAHEVGRHRRRRRRRADGALPLLRVQAALPVRDHGRGDRGLPAALRRAHRRRRRTRSRRSRRCIEDCFDLTEHEVLRNRLLVAEQGLLSRPRGSPREEQARQAARARTRDLEFAWASFLARAMRAGRDPRDRPAPARPRGPRALQQHLAVVPAERDRRAEQRSRTSSPTAARDDRHRARGDERARVAGMTFFERYFERLDGPDPHSSLELVADDVEFSIQWAAGDDRRSSQFLGGLEELRGFIDAGDTNGWAHHVALQRRPTATSSSRSARRAGRERRAHRHVPRGRAARRRRPDARATWSPARRRSRSTGSRVDAGQPDFVPVADGLIAGTADEPRLIGSRVPPLRRRSRSRARRRARAARPRTSRSAGSAARHAVDLDDPVLRAQVAAVRGRRRRLRALRRRLRRAARARCASRRG